MEAPVIIMKTHRHKKILKSGEEKIYEYQRQEIQRNATRGVKPKQITRSKIPGLLVDFTEDELLRLVDFIDRIKDSK